jgi:hypothetical protein
MRKVVIGGLALLALAPTAEAAASLTKKEARRVIRVTIRDTLWKSEVVVVRFEGCDRIDRQRVWCDWSATVSAPRQPTLGCKGQGRVKKYRERYRTRNVGVRCQTPST